jgi:hypothetical protein
MPTSYRNALNGFENGFTPDGFALSLSKRLGVEHVGGRLVRGAAAVTLFTPLVDVLVLAVLLYVCERVLAQVSPALALII